MNIIVYWLTPPHERPGRFRKISPIARLLLWEGAWSLLLILFSI